MGRLWGKKMLEILRQQAYISPMSEGGFRFIALIITGTAGVVLAADPPVPTGVITNTAPLSIGSTNQPAPPVSGGGTNTVLSADERREMEAEAARKAAQEEYERKLAAEKMKWETATNRLGVFHVIPAKDPFRLTRPEIEKPKTKIIARPMTFGVPHLAGISRLNITPRAVLRVNPPRGGKPRYVRLEEGEFLKDADGNEYGEVLKIDVTKQIVEVKVKGQTFPLEIDKTKLAAAAKSSSRRTSGSSRYGRGTSSRSGTSSSRNRPSGGTSRSSPRSTPSGTSSKPAAPKSKGSGGGLRTVPSRRPDKTGFLDKSLPGQFIPRELPAFNEAVQRLGINPLDLSPQREIIRGQYSRGTPTDLPPGQR